MYSKRSEQTRVVIVGGGFAGLAAANAFAEAPVEVLLLDRNNYHTFLPLLYQVAAAEVDPTQIDFPIRTILLPLDNVDFMMAEVERVDMESETVITQQGPVPYDYLILATGSEARFFGIPGAEASTFSMKSLTDGIDLRNHMLQKFEEASREQDEGRRQRLLTFVIIGGGPSGVEYAGALMELIDGSLAKDYTNVYVAGDLAGFEQACAFLPMVAQVAMQQGEAVARNILRQMAGEELQTFRYQDMGSMAVIGRNSAVANIADRAFTGFAAWLIWLLVHIAQLIGYRNRLLVLVNWAWSYFTFERMVRLILPNRLIDEEQQIIEATVYKPGEPEFANE